MISNNYPHRNYLFNRELDKKTVEFEKELSELLEKYETDFEIETHNIDNVDIKTLIKNGW